MAKAKPQNPNKCYYCERPFNIIPHNSDKPLKKTKDHIVPKSKNGGHSSLNIVLACHICNQLKGNKTLEEFESLLTEWIANMFNTRYGLTVELLQTMLKNTKRLYFIRSGYLARKYARKLLKKEAK
ncbi:MAG TPA: HNH endonuclease [Flavisolibacter sp.]|nr:HNH endonuclease [Flavisolibacter sp.]